MMKKIILVFCIGSFASLVAAGQNCKEHFLGSKTLYQPQQQKYSLPPRGYLPVFINHVGRHGARHLTKDVNSSFAYQAVMKADSGGGLTAKGKLLKEKILRLELVEKQRFKSISLSGKKEQEGIAYRMYTNNNNVFRQQKPILHIAYTKEVRTLQTSDAFLSALKTNVKEPVAIKQLNDTTLRFYDMSPAYDAYKENGNWLTLLEQLKTSVKYEELATQVSQQFFTPVYFQHVSIEEQVKLTTELYGFVTLFYSVQQEIKDAGYMLSDVDMKVFFTCRQLSILDRVDNAEDFFGKGPGLNVDGIQVIIALPLLADFISTTDDYIRTKGTVAQLRFGHAETISPYAALLGLIPASAPAKDAVTIEHLWHAEKIIPLSSNIQWILYQKKGSEAYLIKFLLNEKEVAVQGLPIKTFPYYHWTDVRNLYIKKLQHFNTSLNTDFVQFLKDKK